MSITNVEELASLASTSVASYTTLVSNRSMVEALVAAGMAPVQANAFAESYTFLAQQPNVSNNGFSATVFGDKLDGPKVLAIRGTEIPIDAVNDLGRADLVGIGAAGYAIDPRSSVPSNS